MMLEDDCGRFKAQSNSSEFSPAVLGNLGLNGEVMPEKNVEALRDAINAEERNTGPSKQPADFSAMRLVRYCPNESWMLKPKHIEHLIPLKAGQWTLDLKKGVFLTDDIFSTASLAHDYCSLTYYPRFRYTFSLKDISSNYLLFKNNGEQLTAKVEEGESSRVWPAFGNHGGAHEFILDCDTDIQLEDQVKLHDGGAFDSYHDDNVQPYTLALVKAIADGVYAAVGAGEERIENVAGKITDSAGVVLSWTKEKRWYSLSVAKKCFGGLLKLKLWGYTWMDDSETRTRRLFGPYSERLEFGPCLVASNRPAKTSLCEDTADRVRMELEDGLKRTQHGLFPVYERLNGCIKGIAKRLYRVSDTFMELNSAEVPLQTVEAS